MKASFEHNASNAINCTLLIQGTYLKDTPIVKSYVESGIIKLLTQVVGSEFKKKIIRIKLMERKFKFS